MLAAFPLSLLPRRSQRWSVGRSLPTASGPEEGGDDADSEGLKIIRTPVRAPNVNSHAERWIRSVRSECLDKIIIVNGVNARFANKRICAR